MNQTMKCTAIVVLVCLIACTHAASNMMLSSQSKQLLSANHADVKRAQYVLHEADNKVYFVGFDSEDCTGNPVTAELIADANRCELHDENSSYKLCEKDKCNGPKLLRKTTESERLWGEFYPNTDCSGTPKFNSPLIFSSFNSLKHIKMNVCGETPDDSVFKQDFKYLYYSRPSKQ
eukprot:Nk52_evm28s1671 gene=Nk52_evmTU28s1671